MKIIEIRAQQTIIALMKKTRWTQDSSRTIISVLTQIMLMAVNLMTQMGILAVHMLQICLGVGSGMMTILLQIQCAASAEVEYRT